MPSSARRCASRLLFSLGKQKEKERKEKFSLLFATTAPNGSTEYKASFHLADWGWLSIAPGAETRQAPFHPQSSRSWNPHCCHRIPTKIQTCSKLTICCSLRLLLCPAAFPDSFLLSSSPSRHSLVPLFLVASPPRTKKKKLVTEGTERYKPSDSRGQRASGKSISLFSL